MEKVRFNSISLGGYGYLSANELTDSKFDNGLYIWPAMGIEAERWRYVTVRECRKALMEAIPSELDPRAKFKIGFMKNRDRIIKNVKLMLDEMVEYTKNDVQMVEQLVGQMMTLWLEFGMYRCRLVLSMAQPNVQSAMEKARQAEEGDLKLTIMPGLRRHGDVKGVELASSTIVGGFKGEFFNVSHDNM